MSVKDKIMKWLGIGKDERFAEEVARQLRNTEEVPAIANSEEERARWHSEIKRALDAMEKKRTAEGGGV